MMERPLKNGMTLNVNNIRPERSTRKNEDDDDMRNTGFT
jgi:hypothetical protein